MAKFLDLDGLRQISENIKFRLDCKQDKLVGVPGQVVGFGTDGIHAVTINAGNSIELKQGSSSLTVSALVSHQNLLDNWYFLNPINQQERPGYVGSEYTIDRWYSENLLVTLEADGLVLERKDPAIAFIQRWDAGKIKNLVGKNLTLSLLTSTGLSVCVFQIEMNSEGNFRSVILSNSISAGIHTFGPFIGFSSIRYQMVRIVPILNEPIRLVAAKLELGSVQTLAEQNAEGEWILRDPPPDGTQELLKCQRYYQVFSSPGQRPEKAADFRPVMRINPVLGTITRDGETYYTADANL